MADTTFLTFAGWFILSIMGIVIAPLLKSWKKRLVFAGVFSLLVGAVGALMVNTGLMPALMVLFVGFVVELFFMLLMMYVNDKFLKLKLL